MIISILLIFTTILHHYVCRASDGDIDVEYLKCFFNCQRKHCSERNINLQPTYFKWDCLENCEYDCMSTVTMIRISENKPMLKYDGHWPFTRIYGLQEPASVLFSFGNSLPHIYYLFFARNSYTPKEYYLRSWVIIYSIISINAWGFSMIYHAKRIHETALLDYISALLFLSYGLWMSICRIFYPIFKKFRRYCLLEACFILCSSLFIYQVIR